MKSFKIFCALCVFLLISAISYAGYLDNKASTANGAKIVYYDKGDVNREVCKNIVEKIPSKYVKGMTIRVYYFPTFTGGAGARYFWGTKILDLYEDCNLPQLVHELAHKKNYDDKLKLKDTFYYKGREAIHTQLFYDAESKIKESIK